MNKLFQIEGSKKITKKKEREVFDLGYYKQNVHNLSEWWGASIIVLVLILGFISKHQLLSLPPALSTKDAPHLPESFIAERAWTDLRILNDFGPRPTGNYANEVLAVDFLKREISYIQQMANPKQKIYADVQQVTGAYWANFKPHGMTNVYRNVQNVIVKLVGESEGHTNHTLMLNCHFDSVAGSPGASDDAASCCVMLETLRVLSKRSQVLKHSVLFLFNGAEETPLQAAHGFITQHPWAPNVRAFLNLESVGSNGKEILFQSGPQHAWLIDMYQKAAPHPSGQVAAEEIFQSGAVPSDTDFRIFRDFGHIPGMDFAHVMNGYRYHTKYDHIDYIPAPVLQRTGDNILSLVKLIANSDILAHTDAYVGGRNVYFDVLGIYFVSYTEQTGHLINICVALFAIIIPYYFLGRTTKGIHSKRIRKEMIIGFLINILSAVISFGLCYIIAEELDWSGNSMVWYHHTVFLLVLYCCPTVLVFCFFHRILNESRNTPLSLSLKVQARLNGTNLLWSVLLVFMTVIGYRSAYLFMIPLAITLATNLVIGLTEIQNSIKKWLYVHIIGQIFVILWTTTQYHLLLGTFVPMTGRSGSFNNPDITMAVICCALTIYVTSYLNPLIGLLNKTKWFLISLLVLFVVTRWGCISLTHVGFPYRDHAGENPTPQRHLIIHTLRTVHDRQGRITYTDSGFYFKLFDRNAMKTIESLTAPDIPIPQELNNLCDKHPFCGLPFYSSRLLHTAGLWVPGPAPIIKEEAFFKLNSNTKITPFDRELHFTVSGHVLLSIQLRPKPNVHLVKWSLTPTVPEPNEFLNEKAYFVMMTHGWDAEPMNFTLQFKVDNENYDGPLLDVTVVTHHWEYHKEHTSTFAALLAKLPSWAFAVPAVASINTWIF